MGVGAIEKRPKVMTGPDGEDTIAIRTCSYFSISFDHRLIDGAVADQFLAHVKKQLETLSRRRRRERWACAITPADDRHALRARLGFSTALASCATISRRTTVVIGCLRKPELPGAFIEFTESGNSAALVQALAGAPEQVLDPARIYQEVAL